MNRKKITHTILLSFAYVLMLSLFGCHEGNPVIDFIQAGGKSVNALLLSIR